MSLAAPLQNINLDQLAKTALGGADTSGISSAAAQLPKIEKEKEAETGPQVEQIKKQAAADKATVDTKYQGIEPIDVQKWDAEAEKAKRTTDPISAFGSAGTIFAIAASAFTHTPITNALNGAAAAINAIKARDEKSYNDAYDAWQQNTKLALERHNAQHQDYSDALEKMQTDFAQGQALLTMTAAKYGDQATALMNQAGLLERVASLQDSRARSAQSMLEALPGLQLKNLEVTSFFAQDKAQTDLQQAQATGDPSAIVKAQANLQRVQQQIATLHGIQNPYATPTSGLKSSIDQLTVDAINERIQTEDKAAKANGQSLTAQQKLDIAADVQRNQKTGPSLVDDPDALKLAARKYIDTGVLPRGLGTAGDAAVIKAAGALVKDQNFDPTVRAADVRADTNSLTKLTQAKDATQSFEATALANMKIVEGLLDKGGGTAAGSVLNRWIQAGRKATGDVDVAKLDQALQNVATEVAKINSGSTGSQGAPVSAMQEAQSKLNLYNTPDQIRGVLDTMRQDITNRKDGYEVQIDAIRNRLRSSPQAAPTAGGGTQQLGNGSVIPGKDGKQYRITNYNAQDPSKSDVELVQP